MASALLASSRNDSYWGEQQVYMRKTPNLNPNTGLLRPNCNPKFPNNPNFGLTTSNQPNHSYHAIEPDAAAVSDDSSCFNRKSVHRRDSGGGEYVRFNISALSRKELRELKRRLVAELDQVRSVTSRIESRSRSGIYCGGGRDAVVPVRSDGGGKQRPPAPPLEKEKEKEKKVRRGVGKQQQESLLPSPAASMEMVKQCRQILTKMLKMKGCQWFKSPVDAMGMGLHDYHQVVKQPMDLGTVRSRLNKGLYPSPLDFASDVRLTFNNALLYNPQGHEVHRVAALLLNYFDTQFAPIYHNIQPPEPMEPLPEPPPPPPQQKQQQQQPISVSRQKLPNPMAKEEKKRAMTMQQKFELTESLQRLPQEKMDHVLQIMKRRHVVAAQDGDEIELDFEVMDNETLWELDRFVSNFSNTLKEEKEQVEEKEKGAPITAHHHPLALLHPQGGNGNGKSPSGETVGSKKSRPACEDDDVDIIGDGMPPTSYPYPSLEMEIQKDADSSCTSATDSSSSSGSDSAGTSSATDSDSDDDTLG